MSFTLREGRALIAGFRHLVDEVNKTPTYAVLPINVGTLRALYNFKKLRNQYNSNDLKTMAVASGLSSDELEIVIAQMKIAEAKGWLSEENASEGWANLAEEE